MKQTLTILIAITLAACALPPSAPLDPALLPPSAALSFDPPEVERLVLDNGLVVFLLEDHELPLLEVRTITRTGAIFDPSEIVGRAGTAGAVMRTGGTSEMTGDELDAELEFMAAAIETGVGTQSGTSSLSCLMENAERCMELYGSVLRDPEFRQEKIDLSLNQSREGLRRMNDDPGDIARREFRWLVFGQDSPWVRVATNETLDAITREDLIEFHEQWYHPNNTMMAVSGHFDRDEMVAMIERHFGDWEAAELNLPEPPAAPDAIPAGIYFIHRPEVNQTNIRWGHLGLQRLHPDHHAIKVMNFIYGGSGFTSQLMREVRSNRGLTYGVGGLLTEDTEKGFFFVVTFTKSETTGEIIDVMLDVTRDFQSSPPSAELVALAQESEANSFVFGFDSSIAIANKKMTMEYYDYPEDYLETYLDGIQAVTAEDVQRVAQENINLDDIVIMVVGNQDEIGDQLEQFGEVTNLPLIDFGTGEQIWP